MLALSIAKGKFIVVCTLLTIWPLDISSVEMFTNVLLQKCYNIEDSNYIITLLLYTQLYITGAIKIKQCVYLLKKIYIVKINIGEVRLIKPKNDVIIEINGKCKCVPFF